MRWTVEPKPVHDNERIVTKFLLFRKQIGCDVRWLSREGILQRYYDKWPISGWRDVKWMDK